MICAPRKPIVTDHAHDETPMIYAKHIWERAAHCDSVSPWSAPLSLDRFRRRFSPGGGRIGPRTGWGSGNPGRSAGVGCCTTPRHKTHGTESGDEVVVAYAWHSWAGKSVRVHDVIERTTVSVARCSLVGAPVVRTQEIPIWMLDAAACRPMHVAAGPVVALAALVALRSLLSEAITRATAGPPPGAAIASPDHHRGDCYATPPPPASDTGPSTRPLCGGPAVDPGRDPGMEHAAGSDAERGDRTDDPPADRACQRRGRRAGERRR